MENCERGYRRAIQEIVILHDIQAKSAPRFSDGYRHAIRHILDGVKEMRVDIQDPSGEYTGYYPADAVLEMLLDMALNTPDGPPVVAPQVTPQVIG